MSVVYNEIGSKAIDGCLTGGQLQCENGIIKKKRWRSWKCIELKLNHIKAKLINLIRQWETEKIVIAVCEYNSFTWRAIVLHFIYV